MKNYIIAGGSSGIGLELVRLLAKESNKITVLSREPRAIELTENVVHHQVDFSSESTALPEMDLPVHGLVYCPGTINLKPFRMLRQEDFIQDFRINLLGAVRTISAYLPNLKKAESASVLLYSTVAVQTGMAFHASVASAKGAVEGLTRSLAAELAPGIRVNCIAPSITGTPLAEKLLNSEAKLQASEERHPLKRIGNAKDIAALSYFLLSENSVFITGQIIKPDGGISSVKLI